MSSIRSEDDRNWVWPRFPTPLTLESWQEYKADTVAQKYVPQVSQSLIFDSIRAGTTWHIRFDTVWTTRLPTLEGWMSWLEQRKH